MEIYIYIYRERERERGREGEKRGREIVREEREGGGWGLPYCDVITSSLRFKA